MRGAIRSALAVAVALAALASWAPAASPSATWTPPSRALGPVWVNHPTGGLGYQNPSGDCRTCAPYAEQRFRYDNWAMVPRFVIGADANGKLLVTVARAHRLRLLRYTASGKRRLASYAADYGDGWRYGGAHITTDGSVYLVLGRGNPQELDGRVVIQVRHYSSTLVRRGTASYRSGQAPGGIFRPFVYSGTSVSGSGSRLVVSFGRLLYADSNGVRHQKGESLVVDTGAMKASHLGAPTASHHFNGVTRAPGDSTAYVVEHGDAFPRSVALRVKKIGRGGSSSLTLLDITGQTGDNFTGTTVNGLALAGNHALAVGVSVPHRHAIGGVTGHDRQLIPNAYVVSVALTTGEVRFRWLTAFAPASAKVIVGQPSVTALGSDRFVVLFNVSSGRRLDYTDYYRAKNTTRYLLVDSLGRVLAQQDWPGRQHLPVSEPRLVGDRLYWAGLFRSESSAGRLRGGIYLAGIDLADPFAPALLTR